MDLRSRSLRSTDHFRPFFLFCFYFGVGEKYIISCEINFWLPFLNEKSQRHGSHISSLILRLERFSECIYVCECVCLCLCVCFVTHFTEYYTRGTILGQSLITNCMLHPNQFSTITCPIFISNKVTLYGANQDPKFSNGWLPKEDYTAKGRK